jgi:hypothetical protein
MVDSISHGVVGIEEVREKDGKLDSILTSSIPLLPRYSRSAMIVPLCKVEDVK